MNTVTRPQEIENTCSVTKSETGGRDQLYEEDDGIAIFRGLIWAVPISIMIWIIIVLAYIYII